MDVCVRVLGPLELELQTVTAVLDSQSLASFCSNDDFELDTLNFGACLRDDFGANLIGILSSVLNPSWRARNF